jgi:hypothetical protein
MEAKNPREGWAALILRHWHQRRAGVARIRQTWLPSATICQPDQASQQAWHRRWEPSWEPHRRIGMMLSSCPGRLWRGSWGEQAIDAQQSPQGIDQAAGQASRAWV